MADSRVLGTGAKFPLQVDPATGRIMTVSGNRSVKESIYLILMTQLTERIVRPDFGSDIIRDALDRIRVDNADDKLLLDQEKYMSLKDDYRIVLASAIIRAKEEGRARGLARGLAEGRAEGRAEGAREKGRKIAAFLRAKGVSENLILDALAQK